MVLCETKDALKNPTLVVSCVALPDQQQKQTLQSTAKKLKPKHAYKVGFN
jgi:hypothetical protein